ncbi:MAG: ribbon-helix-helix protein, CopG family [Gemmatimonadota bacterium]
MGTTLTIRADKSLRKALEARARAQGKTLSELAREILRTALEDRPLELKTAHLRGRLSLRQEQTDAWRKALRERNWRS